MLKMLKGLKRGIDGDCGCDYDYCGVVDREVGGEVVMVREVVTVRDGCVLRLDQR